MPFPRNTDRNRGNLLESKISLDQAQKTVLNGNITSCLAQYHIVTRVYYDHI